MLKAMENAKYLNLKKILILFIDEKEYHVLFLMTFPCNYSFWKKWISLPLMIRNNFLLKIMMKDTGFIGCREPLSF